MAVTYMTGFEAQQAATDRITLSSTASYSTAQHRTGAASVRCNPASSATGTVTATVSGADIGAPYTHFGLRIASAPTLDRKVFGPTVAAGNLTVRLTSARTLTVYVNTTLIGTSPVLSLDTWYWIGIRILTGTSVAFLQIDGVDAVTGTATVNASASTQIGFATVEASAVDIYVDDIILDDAGFLAPSKVDMALPISDNTVTGVTGGAGGTTNLWDAVNNTPPAGVASASETNTTNIRFPASVTESYIANLETYTTLGVASGDTVIAVNWVLRHGEDIATGTKNGTMNGVTNPAINGPIGFAFGNDGGAHAAESGANFWVALFGATIINTTTGGLPTSGNYGTSPTIRVDRVSEARVGCIDFMGLIVAWTPAVAAANPPHSSPYPPLLAQ